MVCDIEKIIIENGYFIIRNTSNIDIEGINILGFHSIANNIKIVYDLKTLSHYKETVNSINKTRRLNIEETLEIINFPDLILPNFIKGKNNSYIYLKRKGFEYICIVEILENFLRVSHSGFVVKDQKYLAKEKELRKSILEGRHIPH